MNLRTPGEVAAIDRAATLACEVLETLIARACAGVATRDLDWLARGLIADAGAEALFPLERNARGEAFPGAVSISINDEILNGVPGDRVISAGDLVTVDLGLRLDGWCADLARSVVVEGGAKDRAELIELAEGMASRAAGAVRAGRRWGVIADEAAAWARGQGVSVIAGFAGHGIGRHLHEQPLVAFRSSRGGSVTGTRDDFELRAGMVLPIEPLVAAGEGAWVEDGDGWTVRTADGSVAAGVEWMIAVEEGGGRRLGRTGGA
ncbi:MAG: M24 family metallopeptidase [Phycisphaerales bacterium JB037]